MKGLKIALVSLFSVGALSFASAQVTPDTSAAARNDVQMETEMDADTNQLNQGYEFEAEVEKDVKMQDTSDMKSASGDRLKELKKSEGDVEIEYEGEDFEYSYEREGSEIEESFEGKNTEAKVEKDTASGDSKIEYEAGDKEYEYEKEGNEMKESYEGPKKEWEVKKKKDKKHKNK